MDFELTFDEIPSPTTDRVKERLAQGQSSVVVGRPGTGKTHAVRAAVNGAAWVDLHENERQFEFFFADLAAQLAGGERIVDALRRGDASAVLEETDAALSDAPLVVDRAEHLHFDDTWGWDDPVEAIWRPDQARLAQWIGDRLNAHPTVVVARGRQDFFPHQHRVHHIFSQEQWPIKLSHSERGYRDWPALGDALQGLPAGLWVGALLLELMGAGEFNSFVRSLASRDEDDRASPQDVLRELLGVLRDRMPDDWRRALATVHILDGSPANVVERVLSPADVATLRYLEELGAVTRRKDNLSLLPALLLAGPIADLWPSERKDILPKAAEELLERVPVLERPDARSAQWIVRAHALYVETGNLELALRTAQFRIGGLVRLARATSLASNWSEAHRIYSIVEPLAAHEPRVHSYVIHYQYMNGRWAGLIPPGAVLNGLQRARGLWPQNALWWEREVEVLLELGRGKDALSTIERAYEVVPEHPRRDLFLRVRPASHASSDDIGAYLDALRILEPLGGDSLHLDAEARAKVDLIFARWSAGVPLPELGRNEQGHLVFHEPILVALERLGEDDFRAESRELERAARASTALGALDKLAQAVADDLRALVENPSTRLSPAEVHRKGSLIGLVDLLNSDIGLPHPAERWILGRFEDHRFVPLLTALPAIDLDFGVALPPAGPHTLYFGKFPVYRDGRPSGAATEWEHAGSGRSIEELWMQLRSMGHRSHG